MSKLTDAEILKALECCRSENGNDCENCPYSEEIYKQGEGGCCNRLMANSLDLINRQQEQIKKLETIERFATKTIEKQDAEIERLKTMHSEMCIGMKVLKKKAIEKFAERLKEKTMQDIELYGSCTGCGTIENIDNLVKETEAE